MIDYEYDEYSTAIPAQLRAVLDGTRFGVLPFNVVPDTYDV